MHIPQQKLVPGANVSSKGSIHQRLLDISQMRLFSSDE
jgi:hypothetical protein